MSIQERLDAALKDAMRSRQADVVACIRQIKSKVQETVNQATFQGAVDDALHQQVIGSYVKSLEKGITELSAAGARSETLVARYRSEIDYLRQYLPQMLDEAATQTLVQQAIAQAGATQPRQVGQVLGMLMKEHRGRIDAALAKRLAEAALQSSES
jgi:hypothetical protein